MRDSNLNEFESKSFDIYFRKQFAPEKSKVRLIFAADVERLTTRNTIFPYDGGTCD